MKKDDKVIKLFDEEGNEVKFNVVAFFDIVNPETDEKNEYVIVYEDGYSEDDAFALKVINGEDVQDLNGLYVFPGLVESHCHLGMEETAIRFEGDDVNEITDPITPNMRGIDGCNPMDETVELALKGGVTTVAAGPGSANVIGGTFFAYKTVGNCIDEMSIQNPLAMKAAFGENPKRCYKDKKIDTRMQISALLRETLAKTKEYMEKKEAGKEVAYDQKLEAMMPLDK